MISFSEQPGGDKNAPSPKPEAQSPKPDGNVFLVGLQGNDLIIVSPPPAGRPLTRAQAINLAAWLAVLADPDGIALAREIEAIKQG